MSSATFSGSDSSSREYELLPSRQDAPRTLKETVRNPETAIPTAFMHIKPEGWRQETCSQCNGVRPTSATSRREFFLRAPLR